MTTVLFTAPDISCDHCRRAIETAVGAMAGVEGVVVDVAGKTVQVAYDPDAITSGAIAAALDDEGYPVEA